MSHSLIPISTLIDPILICTPKFSVTGTQFLGGSVNGDGSINSPFIIANIQNQDGNFYIESSCDVDVSNLVLLSVFDNVLFD